MGNRDSAIAYAKRKEPLCQKHDIVEPELYQKYGVLHFVRKMEKKFLVTVSFYIAVMM